MTKDEIKLVTFIIFALLVGAVVQWWNTRSPSSEAIAPVPTPGGWAKPPYVFKDRKQMEKTAADVIAPEKRNLQ